MQHMAIVHATEFAFACCRGERGQSRREVGGPVSRGRHGAGRTDHWGPPADECDQVLALSALSTGAAAAAEHSNGCLLAWPMLVVEKLAESQRLPRCNSSECACSLPLLLPKLLARALLSVQGCWRRFSIASIMGSRHDHEIRPDDLWHVHLDAAHIGSGGDDSWSPSVHKASFSKDSCITACCAVTDE